MDVISLSKAVKALREVIKARTDNSGVSHPSLKDRLDKDALEVAQARVDSGGVAHPSLKDRLNSITTVTGGASYLHQEFPAGVRTTVQRIFTISSYPVGGNVLEVYVDGIRMAVNVDYVETDSTTVTFNFDIGTNSHVTFHMVGGTDPEIRSEVQTARGTHTSLSDRLNNIKSTPDVNQVTKTNVTASTTAPYIVDVTIPETTDFKVQPVRVLKFVEGQTDVIKTTSNFDNADASSFTASDKLVFDGRMYLKTAYQSDMVDGGALGSGKVFSVVIDKDSFSKFEKVEVI